MGNQERPTPGFARSIGRIQNYLNRILNKFLKTYPIPLSLTEYLILWTINENPELSQYRISQISGFSIQRCNQISRSLIDSGLIMKKKKDLKRKHSRTITDLGITVVNEIYDMIMNYLSEILTEEELQYIQSIQEPMRKVSEIFLNNNQLQKDLRS